MLAKKLEALQEESHRRSLQCVQRHASGISFELRIDIDSILAIPSAKCCNCGNSTIDFFEYRKIRLVPEDEKALDSVIETINKEISLNIPLGSSHVLLITDISVIYAWRINSYDIGGAEIIISANKKLDERVLGAYVCNGCLTSKFIEEKLGMC